MARRSANEHNYALNVASARGMAQENIPARGRKHALDQVPSGQPLRVKRSNEDPAAVRKGTNEFLGLWSKRSEAIHRWTPYFLDWVLGIYSKTYGHGLVTQIGVFGRKRRFRLLLSAPQDERRFANDQPRADLRAIVGW
jgi:hypothetical protein